MYSRKRWFLTIKYKQPLTNNSEYIFFLNNKKSLIAIIALRLSFLSKFRYNRNEVMYKIKSSKIFAKFAFVDFGFVMMSAAYVQLLYIG